jgi:hypothetical protein
VRTITFRTGLSTVGLALLAKTANVAAGFYGNGTAMHATMIAIADAADRASRHDPDDAVQVKVIRTGADDNTVHVSVNGAEWRLIARMFNGAKADGLKAWLENAPHAAVAAYDAAERAAKGSVQS